MDIRKSKVAFGGIFLSVVLFILTIVAVGKETELAFDKVITDLIHTLFPSTLNFFFEGISELGDKTAIGIVALLFVIWLWVKKKDYAGMAAFVLCVGLGNEVNKLVKDFIARPRPETAHILEADSFSFPSGHAMVGLLLYLFIAHLLAKDLKSNAGKLALAGIAMLLIVLIGISRIVLGAHYPTDVIGGYLFGGIWLFIWIYLYETFHVRLNRTGKKRV